MFRSKADVDRHVHNVLRKVKNDKERNLRCCSIAQLYYKLQDYDSAKRFVTMYLSEKPDSAIGYKLLGQACEGLNQINNALTAYKKSLQLEANQMDLVLKICDLLCDKDVEFDSAMAKYWVEKASQLFPHEPVVFKLKERLLTANMNGTSNDLEGLLLAELKARPNDVNIRIKWLMLQVDSGRIVQAYNHTLEIESRQVHSNCLAWYQCVNHVCKVYSEKNTSKCDWIFYIHWFCSLNRICALTLSEVAQNTTEITECTEAVFNLDQILNQAYKQIVKAPEMYNEFLKHVSAQLAFYLALLLMKQAKKENSIWKDVKKALGPLFLLATVEPPSCDAVWCLSLKDSHRKLVGYWSHEGMCRLVQATHVLKAMSQESQTQKTFIDKINHYTTSDWRGQIYKAYVSGRDDQQMSSFFVNSNVFVKIPQSFPSLDNLKNSLCSRSFEVHYPRSLHHLVWLGLQSIENRGQILSCKLSSTIPLNSFKSLQLTVKNLQNCGVESLNQLDVESFLYTSIFSVSALQDETSGFSGFIKPAILPADISSLLCTPEQSKWWSFACGVKSGSHNTGGNKMSELRHILQKGIQIVRGEDLPLPLIIVLARTFAFRAEEAEKIEEAEACDNRALYLWQKACQQLEQYESKEGFRQKFNTSNKMFEYPNKQLSNVEVAKLLNEGRYFIGCYYMKMEQLEQAVELLKPIKTVDATYRLAEIYHSLAEEQISGFLPSEVTPEVCNRQKALLNKAKDYCVAANDMIRNVQNHPFQDRIDSKLSDIKELVSQIDEGVVEKDTLGNISFLSESSHINDTVHSPVKFQNISRNINASTPSRRSYETKHRPNCADLVELVSLQQSNSQLKMQQVLEQTRLVLNRVETVMFELTTKFNNLETEVKSSLSDIKKEVKKSDIYNVLDEEDYNDEMLQCNYPTTPYYQTHQRPVQNNQHFAYSNTNVTAPPYMGQRPPEQMYQNNMGFLPYSDQHQQQQGLSEFFTRPGCPFPTQILNQKLQQPIQNPVGVPGVPSVASLTQGLAGSSLTALPGSHLQPLTTLSLGQTSVQSNPTFPQTLPKFPVLNASQPSDRGPTNVVITTSDTLPTGIPPVQPMLSVTIPPQHRLGDTSVHNYQIPLPTSSAQAVNPQHAQSEVESDDETIVNTSNQRYDPMPVTSFGQISLATEEANEEVLFNSNAVLCRFVEGSCKEKEEGVIKILKGKAENKARILMRKNKDHKICANHFITADLTLTVSSPNSWIWSAQDFTKGPMQLEQLCVQFKTKAESEQFKMVFDKVKNTLHKEKSDQSFSATLMTSTQSTNSSFNSPSSFTTQFPLKTTTPVFTPPKLKLPQSLEKSSEKKEESFSSSTPEKHNVGGFIFSAPPTIKSQDKQEKPVTTTPAEEKKSNAFVNFSFKQSLFSSPPSKGVDSEVKDNNTQQPSSSKSQFSVVNLKSSSLSNVVPTYSEIKKPETTLSSTSPAESKSISGLSKINLSEIKPPQTSFLFSANQPTSFECANPFAIDTKKQKTTVNTFLSKPFAEQQNTQSNFMSKPSDDTTRKPDTTFDHLFSKKLEQKSTETAISDKNSDQSQKNQSESGSNAFTKDVKDFDTLSKNIIDFSSLAKSNQEKGFNFAGSLRTGIPEAGSKVWGGFQKSTSTFQASGDGNKLFSSSNLNTSTGNEVSDDGDQGEYIPTVEFKPVVDMPAEIEVVSGEENEIVLFEERAKLYRFDLKNHEWKERGVGKMKILKDKDTGVVRLLMRREQVFKVCCNHRLTKDIVLTCKGPNRYQWMATDFSEDITSGVNEVFTIKFKTEEQKSKFKAVFDKAQSELESASTPSKTPAEAKEAAPLSMLVKHKEGSWECPGCYIRVEGDCAECKVCKTPNPSKPAAPKTSQPQTTVDGTKFKFGIPPATTTSTGSTVEVNICKPNTPKFSFGYDASSTTAVPDKFTVDQGGSNKFSSTLGLGFNNTASVTDSKQPQESKFVFNDSQKKGLNVQSNIFGNTFSRVGTQEPVTFGSLIKTNEETKPAGNSFLNTSNKFGSGISFGSSPQFQFSKTFSLTSPQKAENAGSDDDTANNSGDIEDEGEHIQFQPVIEMPDKIEVVTGEEDETVLFSERAKLFRFATKGGEWKERGVGDVKILKHKTNNTTRILMRREIVMKLCLNHYITPDIQMESKGKKSWMWSARDFSEGLLASETFSIRFTNESSAVKFHDIFLECQKSATSTDSTASAAEHDFEVVFELKVPDDLRQKALALQLPPNFYAYLQRPKCPGCAGCESDDENIESDCDREPGN
ncbi:E3 SUMO-protein ligase RanBP2-like isoform X1 [Cimex lectularius]|uniref:E3 SUMO-protein ligase RanBP2 n=1 Tax=Cimex lectularius TaxID=79782 RepID=A0A8I6SHF8_CIMLE|nr:E3 SUMO-protein ligase RanBP2-like isoform X1 [Cimex lectularius]